MIPSDVTSLALKPGVRTALLRRARAADGRECCGALLGCRDRVLRALAVPNSAEHPGAAYAIRPERWLRIERAARAARLDVLGFYHSHPRATPVPSPTDHARAWPGYVYLIVGLAAGEGDALAAWRLRDDRSGFERLRLLEAA
jgi:desampylase